MEVDSYHAQCLTNARARTRSDGCVGSTSNSGAPSAPDINLASEITTEGYGRADATTRFNFYQS